jgi:branched-chain amino acid aminotransferase
MATLVDIDGRIVEPHDAAIPVFDRGFLYGDSIYEVMRTYGGEPFAVDQHLDRLSSSARLLDMPAPADRSVIRARIQELLRRTRNAESYIRIIATRGEGEIALDPAAARDPHLVIIVKPLDPLPEHLSVGVSVKLVDWGRSPKGALPAGSKTGNYLANIMALGRARREGHHEAVLVEAGGHLAEGASSNIFIVRDEEVATPSLGTGILPGITRGIVIELCRRMGLPVEETDLFPANLKAAGEAFLTSTLREVLPVVRVDDTPVGDGAVGRLTTRIRKRYHEHVRRQSAGPRGA